MLNFGFSDVVRTDYLERPKQDEIDRLMREEFIVDKYLKMWMCLSFVVSMGMFALLSVVFNDVGIGFAITWVCVILFFVVIISAKMYWETRRRRRIDELYEEIEEIRKIRRLVDSISDEDLLRQRGCGPVTLDAIHNFRKNINNAISQPL